MMHQIGSRSLARLAGPLAALVMIGLAPAAALAQGATVEAPKKKSDVSKELERSKDRSKRLDVDKTQGESELAGGPESKTDLFEKEEQRSPEEIERLKAAIEAKNRKMIAKLDKVIQGAPDSPNQPEWLFQKAELLWELRNYEYLRARAEYNQCLEAAEAGRIEASKCAEPESNYDEAQAIYEKILARPDADEYARLDEVLYRLGRGMVESDQDVRAAELLGRLVQNYPDSRYRPEAQLALGEISFDANNMSQAGQYYSDVLKVDGYDLREYARYKLAWTYQNQGRYQEAANTFAQVAESKDDSINFRNNALNDMIKSYAEIDGGWEKARDYYLKYDKAYKTGDKKFAYSKMATMADYLENKGLDDEAVAVFNWFIKERPNHQNIPQWMESIIIAKKKDVNNLEDTERAMNRFVAYLDPSGTWAQQNKENKGALGNADLLAEASLAYLSNVYHVRGQKQNDLDSYKKAAKYYEQFVERFPEKPASFDMNYLLGEIYLYDLKQLDRAAAQYQKVVDLYKADKVPKGVKKEEAKEVVEGAAYAVVSSYSELVKENCPDSHLVLMAKAADSSRGGTYKAKQTTDLADDKPNPKVDIKQVCGYELGFVEASDQWSEMYPKDDRTPTIDYVSAEIYKARGHYDRSIPRYESIIVNAPKKHKYRGFAGASLLDANYRLKNWDEVEKWARYLIENDVFYVQSKDALQKTIAFAINERAKEIKLAGDTNKAASELLRLADEFPDSELAPGAVFNAAAIYEAGDEINKAFETYERVVAMRPKSEEAKEAQNTKAAEALFVMGEISEARADFDNAAAYFERLADEKYRGAEQTADAIYNAGVLRQAMEQWEEAIGVYDKYVALYGEASEPDKEASENVRQIKLLMGELEEKRGEPKKALAAYEKALSEVSDLKPAERVALQMKVGKLLGEVKEKRWEKRQAEAYEEAFEAFATLTPPGEGAAAEEKALFREARDRVAEARFLEAEKIFDDFLAVKLNFPMNKLVSSLKKKGELQQEAEQAYLSIFDLKSPYYVSAAAYRIGQMYKDFSDVLYNMPLPDGLNEDQQDAYRMQLDEYTFPLQEKALLAFQKARALALELKAYNEWSRKSSAVISKLEAEAYPITGQQGVETGHSRLQFTRTQPVVAVDAARERLKSRKPAPAARPAPSPQPSANPNPEQASR